MRKKEFLIFGIIISLLLVLLVFALPSLTTVTLTSSGGNNITNENLTVTTDQDGNASIKLIYNWLKDETSIAALNMPFENNTADPASTTKDYSGYDNNGTITGATWSETGGYDGKGAYYFNSLDTTKIDISTLDMTSFSELTICVWLNDDDLAATQFIFTSLYDGGDDIRIYAHAAGFDDGTFNYINFALADNVWNHLCIRQSNSENNLSAYVNGVIISSTTDNFNYSGLDGVTYLGARAQTVEAGYEGFMDDVSIYNKALSAEQIWALYENRTDLIVSQETRQEERWQAETTPNDGTEDGISILSNNLLIYNMSIENLLLSATSTDNSTSDNLTLNYDLTNGSTDAIINWYLNGTSLTVLNMPFDVKDNPGRDYSPYDNNGTITGATWSETGGYDGKGAYEFDGVDDYISVPNNPSLIPISSDFTMSAWVKSKGAEDANPYVLSKMYLGSCGGTGNADGYNLQLLHTAGSSNPEYPRIWLRDKDNDNFVVASSIDVNDDTWHHIVGVRDSDLIKIYVDGVFSNSTNISGIKEICPTRILFIGSYFSNDANINGSIDNVMVFNRSLTPEQIWALYENRTDLIVSNETALDDVWNATITPINNYEDGTIMWSNTMTILEEPEQEPDPDPVPEFSDYAIALLLLTVVGGFFFMRRNNS